MDGFQTVAHVWKRAADDYAHGVVEVRALQLVLEADGRNGAAPAVFRRFGLVVAQRGIRRENRARRSCNPLASGALQCKKTCPDRRLFDGVADRLCEALLEAYRFVMLPASPAVYRSRYPILDWQGAMSPVSGPVAAHFGAISPERPA